MSLETYLSLTEEDIQYLISTGLGDSPNNPFHGSATKKLKSKEDDIYEEPHDNSLDYEVEDDEIKVDHAIDLDSIPDQDTLD